jgi:hypothetical protein
MGDLITIFGVITSSSFSFPFICWCFLSSLEKFWCKFHWFYDGITFCGFHNINVQNLSQTIMWWNLHLENSILLLIDSKSKCVSAIFKLKSPIFSLKRCHST